MKVWDVTMGCDHKVLIAAPSVEDALRIAKEAGGKHGGTYPSPLPGEQPTEVSLTDAGVLVWYPGPFSEDAIVDEEG